MLARIEDFESGAASLSLELSSAEVDSLIEALKKLKAQPDSHFHFRSTFERTGIGDIEFSCSGQTEHDYLKLEV